jgi:hypothetical protein
LPRSKPPLNLRHGHAFNGKVTPTYRTWHGMLSRCYCSTNNSYASYGGRGVRVCDRWNPAAGGSFANFLADMGERPADRSLDKDIRGSGLLYSPEACCWATKAEQARHKRDTRLYTYEGRTQCFQDWATELGLKWTTFAYRVESGWSPERLMQGPTLTRKLLTWNGKTQQLSKWAAELGVQPQLIRYRLSRGWSVEQALATAPRSKPGCR